MTDFFVNKSPQILAALLGGDTAHFTITPYVPAMANAFLPELNVRQFRPYKCTTVLEYFNQIHKFCTYFSYIYSRSKQIIEASAGFAAGPLAGRYNVPVTTAINYLKNDWHAHIETHTHRDIDIQRETHTH